MSTAKDFGTIFLLLLLASPLFFYKLGQSSLVSWDEAWYAEISRNIVKSGDFLNLSWNGMRYFEHPPVGFWLTSLVFKIFGTSEFWARSTQAIAGLGSLTLVYLLGKELFNRWVGFSSAIALSSAIWFVYRARSGNLDITLTFFFLLSLLFAIKAFSNHKFLIPLSISTSLLFLTKAIVPFTIIPSFLVVFWGYKIKLKNIIFPISIFVLSFGGYFLYKVINEPNFLSHYLITGLPGISTHTNFIDNVQRTTQYLHSGIGKWFWPGLLGIILGPLFLQRRFFVLSIFFITFFVPFIFSQKGHIWHLIPLYPITILAFFGFTFTFAEKVFKKLKLAYVVILLLAIFLAVNQIRLIWYQFIDIPAYVSDEAILSKEASKYPYKLLIDGDFDPAAAFYSGKIVKKVLEPDLKTLFGSEKNFLLITNIWRIEQSGISQDQYNVLKTDRDKVLILRK